MYSKLELDVINDVIDRLTMLINDNDVETLELKDDMYDLIEVIYAHDNNSGSILCNKYDTISWISTNLHDIFYLMQTLENEMENDFLSHIQNLMFEDVEQFHVFVTIELANRILNNFKLNVNENGIVTTETLKILIGELEG